MAEIKPRKRRLLQETPAPVIAEVSVPANEINQLYPSVNQLELLELYVIPEELP
jgi:hypothetical protein